MKTVFALILSALLCASLTSCAMIDADGGEPEQQATFFMQKPKSGLKDLFNIFD